ITRMASLDGRNTGLNDPELFYRTDPDGFFIAVTDGNILGSISAVGYDSCFGFIGHHLVLPEFQYTEVEDKLLEVALQKLGDRIVGLNCYESQLPYYSGHGFNPAGKIFTYKGTADGKAASMESIVSPFMHPLRLLLDVDKECYPYNREEFLALWLQQPQSLLFAKMVDGKYSGYGLYSPCAYGYKIAPLICNDPASAGDLLAALVYHMKEGTHFFLDLPEQNEEAIRLAEKMNMKKIKESVRMYNNSEPGISLPKVFGFTNNELG
ncbi:MAG: hypothetical protein M1480_17090, partial [Bacteroidetes bacterium]|nr:hypothetical protein [Bacteroidota bacterium]